MRWMILSLLSLLIPSAVLSAEAIDEANRLLTGMEYDRARAKAEEVLRSPTAGRADLIAAYRIQGLCLSAKNEQAGAVEAFRRLLAIDPDFRLGDRVSPKLRDPFYKAVGMSVDQKPITAVHTQPKVKDKLGGIKLRARLTSDPLGMVHGIRFRYQMEKGGAVRELAVLVQGPKTISFKLPDQFKHDSFRYWVEVFNKHGGVLTTLGSKERPFILRAPSPTPLVARTGIPGIPPPAAADPLAPSSPPPAVRSTAWYETWWFWTAVGVVVAGTVTGAALAASGGDSPSPLHWNVDIQ